MNLVTLKNAKNRLLSFMILNKAYCKRNKGYSIKNVTYKKEQNKKLALYEVRNKERK